jgi:hypothetical protein
MILKPGVQSNRVIKYRANIDELHKYGTGTGSLLMKKRTHGLWISVVDPKQFFSDPDSDPILVRVLDPDPL